MHVYLHTVSTLLGTPVQSNAILYNCHEGDFNDTNTIVEVLLKLYVLALTS